MKKLFGIFLTVAVTATFAACGSKPDSSAEGGEGIPEEMQETTESGSDGEGESEEHPFSDLREFRAAALDGSTFTQENFGDRDVTAINFWALSCRPCIAEMPDLAELERALPDNVQLITVCLDGSGNEELVQYVLEESGYEGITLLAGDGDMLTLAQELQYTPTTLFFDSEGNAVGDVIIGGRENLTEDYTACINDILSGMGKEEIVLETDG